MATSVQYQGFTGLPSWWSIGGDSYAIDVEFQAWITAVNANPSQLNRQVQYYYGPVNGSSSHVSDAKGSLAAFPQSSTNSDLLWFGWWCTFSELSSVGALSVQMFDDWSFGPFNNGYGQPGAEAKGTEVALAATGIGLFRGYLIGTGTDDNKEFFALGWDHGVASAFHNAFIIYKAKNGTWTSAAYSATSNTALCYSTTNNTWNLNSNSKLTSPTVMLPLAHGFVPSTEQNYEIGQFTAQAASSDLYAVGQISEFGAYADLQDGTYVTSLGYNAFWVRYQNTATPTPNPTTTYTVTVVNSGSNIYAIDGVNQDTLTMTPGNTYVFDQSDSSNTGHPIAIYEDAAKTTPYTNGVTSVGLAGSTGAQTTFVVPQDAPSTLYYQCQAHAGMGGLIEVV